MNKSLVIFLLAGFALTSCKKTEDLPATETRPVNNTINAPTDTAIALLPVAAKGGPGGGGSGGGGNTGATNLDIYIKQLTGSWLTVVGIPGTTGTIFMTITFKSNGSFTLVAVNNVTGGQTTNSGNWQFTIPTNLPINESGLFVLTNGSGTLMSGLLNFIHPE